MNIVIKKTHTVKLFIDAPGDSPPTSSTTDSPADMSPLVHRHSSCSFTLPSGSTSGIDLHTPVINSPRALICW